MLPRVRVYTIQDETFVYLEARLDRGDIWTAIQHFAPGTDLPRWAFFPTAQIKLVEEYNA